MSPATVTGFESQLTVPSRHDARCVDLWFSLQRSSAEALWDEEFKAAQQEASESKKAYRTLELFPFTPEHGWIVVRGVDPSVVTQSEIESELKGLVARVNVTVRDLVASSQDMVRVPAWKSRLARLVTDLSPVAALTSRQPVSGRPTEAGIQVRVSGASALAARIAAEYNQDSGAARTAAETVA